MTHYSRNSITEPTLLNIGERIIGSIGGTHLLSNTQLVWPDNDLFTCSQQSLMKLFALWAKNGNEDLDAHSKKQKLCIPSPINTDQYSGSYNFNLPNNPPVDLHWFFEISISAFISNLDKSSVIN